MLYITHVVFVHIVFFTVCQGERSEPTERRNQLRNRGIEQKLISYCRVVSHIYKIVS